MKRIIELLDDDDVAFIECMGGPDGPWRPWDEECGPYCALRPKTRRQYLKTTHFGQKINHFVGWTFQRGFADLGCYGDNKKYYVRHFKTAEDYTAAGLIREGMIDHTIKHCIANGLVGKDDGRVYLSVPSSAIANLHIAKRFNKLIGCEVHNIFKKNNWSCVQWDDEVADREMKAKSLVCKKRFIQTQLRYWDIPYVAHDYQAMSRKPIRNTFKIKSGISKVFLKSLSNKQIVLLDDTLAEGGTAGNILMALSKYGVQEKNVFLITIMEDF